MDNQWFQHPLPQKQVGEALSVYRTDLNNITTKHDLQPNNGHCQPNGVSKTIINMCMYLLILQLYNYYFLITNMSINSIELDFSDTVFHTFNLLFIFMKNSVTADQYLYVNLKSYLEIYLVISIILVTEPTSTTTYHNIW